MNKKTKNDVDAKKLVKLLKAVEEVVSSANSQTSELTPEELSCILQGMTEKELDEVRARGIKISKPKRNYPSQRKKVEKDPNFTKNINRSPDTSGATKVIPVRLDEEDIAALDALTGDGISEGRSPRIRQAVREYIARHQVNQ